MADRVILVDNKDKEIGTEEKLEAHRKGERHRAFSIFIFNKNNELLLQRRAKDKYHSPGLWANTCCSHPGPNEKLEEAIHRRLKEEMGFDCMIKEIFVFSYNFSFSNGLTENEVDHVFAGFYDGKIKANPREVDDYKWVRIDEIKKDISKNPKKYAEWFKAALKSFDFGKFLEQRV